MSTIKEIWKKQWLKALTEPSIQTAHWNKIVSVLRTDPEFFLDIGAGEFDSEAWEVKKTYPDCRIIGFEPQPDRFDLLKRHSYPGLLLPFVISDVDSIVNGYMGYHGGKSDFWLFGGNDEYIDAYKKIKIMSHTLDAIEYRYGPFNNVFIWADIEGSELNALRGANKLFDQNKIIGINVEVRKNPIAPGGCSVDEIFEFLNDKKFYPVNYNGVNGHCDVIFLPIEGQV